jgi:hypothetical protein
MVPVGTQGILRGEEVIKSIIRPELEEGQVLQKRAMWMEMRGKNIMTEEK